MYFQLQPVCAESFACHLCGKDSFFGIAHARSIRQELDVRMADMHQHIVFFIIQFDALHRYRHHLRSGGQDGLLHRFIRIELSRSQEQAGVELTSHSPDYLPAALCRRELCHLRRSE